MSMGAGRLSGVGVFDFDGTLVDTLGEITASLNCVLARHGRRSLSEAEVKILVGRGPQTLLHRAWAATCVGGGGEDSCGEGAADFVA